MTARKRPVHSIHRSMDYERVEWDRSQHPDEPTLEVAFAEAWEDENQPRPGLNYGHGILQDLMFKQSPNGFGARARLTITRRDATIAATVVQWLGTNCGYGFLNDVCKRAGYRLLHPSERDYENNLARRERHLYVRERELYALQEVLTKREAEMAERNRAALQESFERREAELAERERLLADGEYKLVSRQTGFLALLLTANLRVFRRREPTLERGRRQITLGEEATP